MRQYRLKGRVVQPGSSLSVRRLFLIDPERRLFRGPA
jgi:hypothetical protein